MDDSSRRSIAAIILQKVIRGYLTRQMVLRVRLEYQSVALAIEGEGGWQHEWKRDGAICKPQTASNKPKGPASHIQGLSSPPYLPPAPSSRSRLVAELESYKEALLVRARQLISA